MWKKIIHLVWIAEKVISLHSLLGNGSEVTYFEPLAGVFSSRIKPA
jgi:hypothetical protein